MQNEPSKILLAGLVLGAVAIGAVVSPPARQWLSADEPGSARGDGMPEQTRADTMSGTVTQAPVVARGTVAGNLLAARDSLERNDLAGAQAQLNAVQPAFKDDDRVIALKREVAARVEQAQREGAIAQTPADAPPQVAGEKVKRENVTRKTGSPVASSSLHGSGRAVGHAVNRRTRAEVAASGGQKTTSASTASSSTLVANAATPAHTQIVSPPTVAPALAPSLAPTMPGTPLTSGPVTQAAEPAQPAALMATQSTPQSTSQSTSQVPTPSSPRTELTAQAMPQPPLTQNTPVAAVMRQPDARPKTRAEVRAEIARARSDGDLPAFGNPNPAGPGGAPSMTIAPRP